MTYGDLPVVTGNFPQLTQLLQNLIGNAVKYCAAAHPTIEVSASPESGRQLAASAVKDNGIGIAERGLPSGYSSRSSACTAMSEYEGTGLGLATCKKIVERHGGVIRCRIQSRQGYDVSVHAAGTNRSLPIR